MRLELAIPHESHRFHRRDEVLPMLHRQHLYVPSTYLFLRFLLTSSTSDVGTMIQGTTSAGHLNTTCLVSPNPSVVTLSLQMCGNGIVEEGEDCDPGSGVNSNCCDASTCKFTSGSVCDPGSSACCTDTCGFAPQGQVCRAALNATCDYAEVCTGSSASCPADVTVKDGTSCGSGLACASGQCTSLSRAYFLHQLRSSTY